MSIKSLTRSELDRLLEVAAKHSDLDALMFRVIFDHGLRISEALSLTRDNIVDGHLCVQRLKGSRQTCQPLLPDEKDALLALAATTSGPLFPTYRKNVQRKMIRYGAEAGIPRFKCTPHKLKHTTGRLGYLGGMGVPELVAYLGHVNPANSLIYAASDEQTAAAAFAAAIGQ